MRLDHAERSPVRFLLGALSIDPDDVTLLEIEEYGVCDLPRSASLLRAASTIPARLAFSPVDEEKVRGWFVAYRRRALAILVDDGETGIYHLDLAPLRDESSPLPADCWFTFQTRHLSGILSSAAPGPYGARWPAVFRTLSRTRDFQVSWSSLIVDDAGPFLLPVFLDVFRPDSEYAIELLRQVRRFSLPGRRVLVLGSGAGPEAVFLAATASARVDAVDVHDLEVANTRASAAWNGVDRLVEAWRSDGFASVPERYDTIVFHAPLSFEKDFPSWNPRIMDPGQKLIRSVLGGLSQHLLPEGCLFLMAYPERLNAVLSEVEKLDCEAVDPGEKPFRIHRIRPGG